MIPAAITLRFALSCVLILIPLPGSAIPAEEDPPPDPHLNDPKPPRFLCVSWRTDPWCLGKT